MSSAGYFLLWGVVLYFSFPMAFALIVILFVIPDPIEMVLLIRSDGFV
jgi:hypothetical protein